jgi:hypothetical protein
LQFQLDLEVRIYPWHKPEEIERDGERERERERERKREKEREKRSISPNERRACCNF